MTITAATADALEAFALTIFNPNFDPASGVSSGPATGLHKDDPATDAQYLALIAPVMLAIDGLTMAPGFRYTLNFGNALQGRPKHWYLGGVMEYNVNNPGSSSKIPCYCGLVYIPTIPTGYAAWANSYGFTIALATCACICLAWARIIRLWLAGNYPLAVTQPPVEGQ